MPNQPVPVRPSQRRVIAARSLSVLTNLAGGAWMILLMVTGGQYASQLSTAGWIGAGVYVVLAVLLMRGFGPHFPLETRAMKGLNWIVLALGIPFALMVPGYRWTLIPLILVILYLLKKPLDRLMARKQAEALAAKAKQADQANGVSVNQD